MILCNLLNFQLNSCFPLNPKMHILQPKHIKLNAKESKELLEGLNVSKSQIPKISSTDAALPEGCETGDMIKIERKEGENTYVYYRVVV